MKKIFLFLSFFFVLNASDCSCLADYMSMPYDYQPWTSWGHVVLEPGEEPYDCTSSTEYFYEYEWQWVADYDSGETAYDRRDRVVYCTRCEEEDQPLILDDNETIWFVIPPDPSAPEGTCGSTDITKINECSELGGVVKSELIKCCSNYYCVGTGPNPLDDNNTIPDDNQTDPDCPDGQHVYQNICVPDDQCDPDQIRDIGTGQCVPNDCTPGDDKCFGTCQLKGVPCVDDNGDIPDGNDTDGGGDGDPCDYPRYDSDMPLQGSTWSQDACFDDARTFSNVNCNGDPINAKFVMRDGCTWGACYYNSRTEDPDCDSNDSGTDDNSDSGTDDNDSSVLDSNDTDTDSNVTGVDLTDTNKKLDTINDSINNQLNRLNQALVSLDSTAFGIKGQVRASGDQISLVIDSLNKSLGDKLSSIEKAIKDKNLSVSIDRSNDVNITNNIDLNETNDLLRQEVNNTKNILSILNPCIIPSEEIL